MRRREFIAGLASAAAWPVVARAQQYVPVIGFLGAGSPEGFAHLVAGFRQGLNAGGFIEGKTVTIEYRWAEGRYDRLPVLAAELVRRPVAAILASGGDLPTRAAQAATSTIPIIFTHAGDPVAAGLVVSLNRPGGNTTGVNFFGIETGSKQVGLLHTVVPRATTIALLINPLENTEGLLKDVQAGAHSLGLELLVLKASTEHEIDEAFAGFAPHSAAALIIQSEPFLASWRGKIASLAMRYVIPTISSRAFADAGCLLSYGASVRDAYRQAGLYVGRIIKGEKPADLPVVQSTNFELVINLKTAKALGLSMPPQVLAIADEVIE